MHEHHGLRAYAQRLGHRTAWRVVVAAIALAAIVVSAWKLHHVPQAAPPAHRTADAPGGHTRQSVGPTGALPVSVGVVQQRDMPVNVDAIGTIAAANTAIVRAKVSGELKEIRFAEGKPVRAGQVLALIDPRPFEIALAQAQGQLARDQAQLRNAQVDLERYRDLIAKDAAPKQQLDTQLALVQQLQGTVLSDQAAVDNAHLQLSYTRVVAPLSGLAGLKQADLGNVVNPADPNGLVSIAQTQPAAVVFAVPDGLLPRIVDQLRAGVPLRVEAWDRERNTMLAEGRVASNDNAIDVATGTLRLKALFPNTDDHLFANQPVHVRLQVDTLRGALIVPSAAVQRGAPGAYVYAVADDGSVVLKRVAVTATDGDLSAVHGDLRAGDKVVIDGADRLRDGMKVEPIAPAASAPRAQASPQ